MTFDPKTALAMAEQLEQADGGATKAPWQYSQLEFGGRMLRDGNGYVFAQVDDDGNGRACATLRNLAASCAAMLRAATSEVERLRDLVDSWRQETIERGQACNELLASRDQARAECEAWEANARERDATAKRLEDERSALAAEVERMRPVYEAAVAWHKAPHVDNANHAAGDCDECPARLAEAELAVVLCEACGEKPPIWTTRRVERLRQHQNAITAAAGKESK